MVAQPGETGAESSCKDFLKSVVRKRNANKRKAEPDMRIDAILGCTCKRIKLEVEREILVDPENTTSNETNYSLDFNLEAVLQGPDEDEISFPFDSSAPTASELIEDPSLIEEYLRRVEAKDSHPPSGSLPEHSLSDLSLDEKSQLTKENTLSLDKENCLLDRFLESYEIDSFSTDFDCLYQELVVNLLTMEKWINSSSDSVLVESAPL